MYIFFFFQAEDGIRDLTVTGVQTCALPIADSLLGADPGDARGAGAEQTRSLRALRAYALGQREIRAWDLAGAASHFRGAVAADSEVAQAYLWLGQATPWSNDTTSEAAPDP